MVTSIQTEYYSEKRVNARKYAQPGGAHPWAGDFWLPCPVSEVSDHQTEVAADQPSSRASVNKISPNLITVLATLKE